MASHSDQDLPQELLEKLRNLELELEDGDITQKGFEKKKASLLQNHARNADASASNDGQDVTADDELDLGPEPSAADVLDFLDYLPSPTHSPPKPQSGAALMEENHRQLQETSQTSSSPAPTVYSTGSTQTVYTGTQPVYTATHQPYAVYGQPQPQPQAWAQYPDGQYYRPGVAAPRPNRPYDPRMVPRPYQNNGIPPTPTPMRQQYPYQRPPQPQNTYYRPAPQGNPGPAYRPGYNAPPPRGPAPVPQQGSPRPLYRTGTVTQGQPRPAAAYGGSVYRPVPPGNGPPVHGRTSLDSRPDLHYDPGRAAYNYGPSRGAPPPAAMGHRSNIPPEARRGQ